MTATIYDVARVAGVSMATVSRVVNNNPNVKPQTRKKVNEAIEQLGYRPNAVARGLASKKTTTVGVVIPDISNLLFAEIARGIEDIANMYHYNIILSNADNRKEKEIRVINSLLEKQVDGLVFMGDRVSKEHEAAFASAQVPVVLCATRDPRGEFASVDIDHKQAAQDAVQVLIDHGHREIGMIGGIIENSLTDEERHKGYLLALEKAGISLNSEYIRLGGNRYEFGVEAMKCFLEAPNYPTAIFAPNNETAIGVIHAIQDAGKSVPEDVSVISMDNLRLASMVRPQLTSITQPLYDVGAVSMRLLTKLMKKEQVENMHVLLSHEVVKRKSVGLITTL